MTSSSRVAIVTDSTADLPPDIRERRGITMVPLNVHFGDEAFRDQVDLTSEQFMERLSAAEKLPTTSQPSTGLFEQTFRELAQNHEEIVCVLLSSHLSGTVQSAQIAADAVADDIRVEVLDSLNGTLGCGYQVIHAADLASQGVDANVIAACLKMQHSRYHVIFFVETLEHLRRGGRIGKAASLVGSMLKLKPLLRVDEGVVVPFERTRTRRKAINALVDFAENLSGIQRIAALHNTTPDDAQALIDRVGQLATGDSIVQTAVIGPVLSTHIGPGALGLAIEVAQSE
jgi:DegV family protein with EDD domain